MAEERRTQILQIVRTEGRARVNELANRFSSSAVTIRNDLNELHQRGLVLRSHGGAVLPDTILRESPVHERLKTHAEEKRRIGAIAATLINDGETIILDSGTTTLEIARQIKNKQGLQVITNGVNIAAELLDAREVQTFIVGGTLRVRLGIYRWALNGGDVRAILRRQAVSQWRRVRSGLWGERREPGGDHGEPCHVAHRAGNYPGRRRQQVLQTQHGAYRAVF